MDSAHLRCLLLLAEFTCFLSSSSPDVFVMEMDMIPKFSSKDEEIDFWKALSLKYKNRFVLWLTGLFVF